jgi:putative Mn2+ efflux pump MntP
MTGSLFVLGFTLSLDNFRTAVALGAIQSTWRRSVQVAAMFGICDGVAVLVGVLVGQYWSDAMGSTAELIGAIVLGAYGLFLIVRAWLTPEPEGLDGPWAVCGLLVPLSADNVAAGTSLGLLGVSLWVAPAVFGLITAVMALLGLQLGRAVASVVRIRPDLLTGIALVVMATVLGPNA